MPHSLLGVDFGTSHTVAVLNRDGVAVPLLFDSSPILPSAVYAEPGGRLLVGADAVNAARLEPARFEPNPKRRVDDGQVLLGDSEHSVVDLFAAVLTRVRRDCERVLGAPPAGVVLTHPAAWGSARRLVLEDAAAAAGFGDARLLPEPVAAAGYLSEVLRHESPDGSGVVVADLGGGTFDASVVADGGSGLTVLSVDGIDGLGGVDVDHALVTLLNERFADHPQWHRLTAPQTTDDRRLRRTLYQDVCAAKERLSRHSSVDLPVPLVGTDTHFTRDELESLTRPLLERAVRVTRAVMRASRLPQERLSGVLLVGGASRMPLVSAMLHEELGTAPIVLEQPELAVAQGASLSDEGAAVAPVSPITPAPVEPVPTPPAVLTPPPEYATPPPVPQWSPRPAGVVAEPRPASAAAGFLVAVANGFIRVLKFAGGVWTIFLAAGVVGIFVAEAVEPLAYVAVVFGALGTALNPLLLGAAQKQQRQGAPQARSFTIAVLVVATVFYASVTIGLWAVFPEIGLFTWVFAGYTLAAAIPAALLWNPAARLR